MGETTIKIATVSTKMQKADIYMKGAIITRHGSVALNQGRNIVYIEGISDSSMNESIRLQFKEKVIVRGTNVRTGGELRVADVASPKDTSDPSHNSVVQDLIDKIDELDREHSHLKEYAKMWEKNSNLPKVNNFSAEEMFHFLEKVQEQVKSLNSRMDEIRLQKKTLEEKRENAEAIESQKNTKRYIVADLWAELEGRYEFMLSYYEKKVLWEPRYEIVVEALDQPMIVKMQGLVIQDTGEDWNQVFLRLHSGNPNMTNECPVQKPRYLDVNIYPIPSYGNNTMAIADQRPGIAQNMETTILNVSPEGTRVLAKRGLGSDANPERPMIPTVLEENETNMQTTMVEYNLQEKWDIYAGANGNLVDIRLYPMTVTYVCNTVPHIRPEAYLAAIIKGEEISRIPSGKASVYLENNYVGEVLFKGKDIEDEVMIPLGRDSLVSVEHKLAHRNIARTLLKGQIRKEYTYEIRVKNLKSFQMSFRIYDQIPVSRGNVISVEPIDLAGAKLNPETGELCWNLVIGSGEVRILRISYIISHPKDQPIYESNY